MGPTDLLAASASLAAATLRISTPLLFAASGGALCERGGIVNIALEGLLLGGAFAAASAAAVTGSALAGVGAAVLAGTALAGIHALATIRFRIDQIVSGVALNLLAVGLTGFFVLLQFHSRAQSGNVEAARIPVVFAGIDLLVLLALAAPLLAHLILERTTFGLRLRAVGEHPEAAATLGISVGRTRASGVLLSGAFASLGGVWLSYSQHQFVSGMTAGKGFMALAAVIFGGWRPLRAMAACLIFGGLEALAIRLDASPAFRNAHELIEIVPYVATLLVLATAVRRSRAPAALGRSSEA